MRTFARKVIGNDRLTDVKGTDTSTDTSSAGTKGTPPIPICKKVSQSVTLSWSDIIFRKTMKIRSAVPSRGEAVTLQVICSPRSHAKQSR